MKEIDFESEDAALIFCFLLIEYVKGTDPELFKKAHAYAKDNTGIDITNFEIDLDEDNDDDEDDDEDEEDFKDEDEEED